VTKEKKKVIDCLENPHFQSMITLNPNETNLHVIPMGKLNPKVVAVFFYNGRPIPLFKTSSGFLKDLFVNNFYVFSKGFDRSFGKFPVLQFFDRFKFKNANTDFLNFEM